MKLALGFYLGMLVFLTYNSFYIPSIVTQDFTISDFRAQYTGAVLFRKGLYDKLYDLGAQYAIQKEIFPKLIFDQLLPFFSPPLIAMILSPLALLSLKNAYLAFCLLFIIILVLTSLLFFYKTKVAKEGKKLFGIKPIDTFLLISVFFPFWLSILGGQLPLLWILIFFTTYLHLERKRDIAAGLTLSLLSLKTHLLLIPILFLISTRKLLVVFSTLIGVTIIFLISLLFGGLETLTNYFSLLGLANLKSSSFGLNLSHQTSLKGALFWVFGSMLSSPTIVIIWLIVSLMIILICLKHWSNISLDMFYLRLKLLWSMVVTITLLTSVHTQYHDFALFIIPLFLTLQFFLNDYLSKMKQIKKRFWYPYAKYAGMLILILLSSSAVYFPPIAFASYLILLYILNWLNITATLS